ISFPKVFKSTIGRNAFGTEYEGLPGFGMITETDSLKQDGQYPTSVQALAITRRTLEASSPGKIPLRWVHVTWSSPGAERDEHALRASIISLCENGTQSKISFWGNSSRIDRSQARPEAELYVP